MIYMPLLESFYSDFFDLQTLCRKKQLLFPGTFFGKCTSLLHLHEGCVSFFMCLVIPRVNLWWRCQSNQHVVEDGKYRAPAFRTKLQGLFASVHIFKQRISSFCNIPSIRLHSHIWQHLKNRFSDLQWPIPRNIKSSVWTNRQKAIPRSDIMLQSFSHKWMGQKKTPGKPPRKRSQTKFSRPSWRHPLDADLSRNSVPYLGKTAFFGKPEKPR